MKTNRTQKNSSAPRSNRQVSSSTHISPGGNGTTVPTSEANAAPTAGKFFTMEGPVRKVMALLCLFGHSRSVNIEGLRRLGDDATALGYETLAQDYARELYTDWNAADKAERDMMCGGREVLNSGELPAALRLDSTVAKAVTLLEMMAQELGEEEEREELDNPKPFGATGSIAMALECVQSLGASFGAAYSNWAKLHKQSEGRLAVANGGAR